MGVSTSPETNGTWDFRYRPIADDPPRNGEGDHRRWWRGTGGAALRIKDRKHLACPSTMLRMVPLPQRGRIGKVRPPPQNRPSRRIGQYPPAAPPPKTPQSPLNTYEQPTSQPQPPIPIYYALFCFTKKK